MVLFLLILNFTLESHHAPFPLLCWGLVFLSTSNRPWSNQSLTHSSNKYAHRGPLIYKNYKIVVGEFVYTSATNDSYLLCTFLLSDRSCTIARVPHLSPPVPLVSMELVPLLPSSLWIVDSVFFMSLAFAFYAPHFFTCLWLWHPILLQTLHL